MIAESVEALEAEILRHALRVAAEEASIVVVKSAHSAMIVEGADACAGILDRQARLVALSTATNLMHAASLRCSLPAILEDYPEESMQPGDVFVMNDCFRGGIHANDLLVFRPVWTEGRLSFFTGTLIHVADLGGSSAGGIVPGATDVFAEGLQLPPVRLYHAGVRVEEVHRILALNSRTPARVLGDVGALVAGVHVAAQRIEALSEEYGPERLERGIEGYIQGVEQRMRDELAQLAPGVYRGSYVIDDDGLDLDRSPVVRVEATVGGGDCPIRLDFSDTDDQAKGAINAGTSQALTGALYAVRCFVDPSIPMNEGCFIPVEVVFRSGSLLNPTPPAACGGRVVAVTAVCEAVVQALSRARPDHATATGSVIHPFTLAAKAGVIHDGKPTVVRELHVGGRGSFGGRRAGTGMPIKTPTIDLAEVGAGGGSIAWLDPEGIGMQAADLTVEHGLTHLVSADRLRAEEAEAIFRRVELIAREKMGLSESQRESESGVVVERSIDARFVGQAHELSIQLANMAELEKTPDVFRARYRELYGVESPGEVEYAAFRVRLRIGVDRPRLVEARGDAQAPPEQTMRPAWFGPDEAVATRSLTREELAVARSVDGPPSSRGLWIPWSFRPAGRPRWTMRVGFWWNSWARNFDCGPCVGSRLS